MNSDVEIPIANIESELARLWDDEKNKNRIKACLFNLIIYTHDERRANYMREIVNSILEKFPCRIIFIQGDTNPEHDYLTASVSNASIGKEDSSFGCDQITIKASAKKLKRIPFIVLPHIVPDMPVYLLWGQDPIAENDILPYFLQFANRLVFDSECNNNLKQFSHTMLEKIDTIKAEFMDLNWGLISGWREVMAQTFDTPDRIHQLNFSKVIQIGFNSKKTDFCKNSVIQAIYLQGWLAAQLNWKFLSILITDQSYRINYSNGMNEIILTLSPQDVEELPPGSILGIELSSADDNFFFISRKQKQSKVIVHISSLEKCELPFTLPLRTLQSGLNFVKEIFYKSNREHYRNMLQMISQVDWKYK